MRLSQLNVLTNISQAYALLAYHFCFACVFKRGGVTPLTTSILLVCILRSIGL